MTKIGSVCTKNVAQYSCIVAVLLSIMNERDEKMCIKVMALYIFLYYCCIIEHNE